MAVRITYWRTPRAMFAPRGLVFRQRGARAPLERYNDVTGRWEPSTQATNAFVSGTWHGQQVDAAEVEAVIR